MELRDSVTGRIFELRGVIEVSSNPHVTKGWIASLKLTGQLPGNRKMKTLSYSPWGQGKIRISPLFDYNGQATLSPDHFKAFVLCLPIVPYRHNSTPVNLTHEMMCEALADVLSICTCPAVTQAA